MFLAFTLNNFAKEYFEIGKGPIPVEEKYKDLLIGVPNKNLKNTSYIDYLRERGDTAALNRIRPQYLRLHDIRNRQPGTNVGLIKDPKPFVGDSRTQEGTADLNICPVVCL